MQSSNYEEIGYELEALKSIYDADLTSISDDPPRFKIKLAAELNAEKSSEIIVEFVLSDAVKGVSLSNITDIGVVIEDCITSNISSPMVFSICESVKDYMSHILLHNSSETKTSAERREFDIQESRHRTADELANAVTVESFARWSVAFKAESRAKSTLDDATMSPSSDFSSKRNKSESRVIRPTGRQIFTGSAASELEIPQENDTDTTDVVIDDSLFDEDDEDDDDYDPEQEDDDSADDDDIR